MFRDCLLPLLFKLLRLRPLGSFGSELNILNRRWNRNGKKIKKNARCSKSKFHKKYEINITRSEFEKKIIYCM